MLDAEPIIELDPPPRWIPLFVLSMMSFAVAILLVGLYVVA